ncbi:hypothetical protein PPL_09998 [Heterostelium album PN500]|uniref:Uncharacterized protein n=1 Tax=Heterostelium pallidum (strain ATCC 26659 / Pp 5 / PN500) TaxID=670386 RepID=D3BPV4_HETP5|nr:hypothetical protein PPL_09998 [Heterostelium album PN500]EFA76237.1 hypothetical protein PPL_09998 [Heterostelium album PN500]|eukprot:XP_020428370.1 hypothetical protein PPL_09998 [Heterostelium album PN500]
MQMSREPPTSLNCFSNSNIYTRFALNNGSILETSTIPNNPFKMGTLGRVGDYYFILTGNSSASFEYYNVGLYNPNENSLVIKETHKTEIVDYGFFLGTNVAWDQTRNSIYFVGLNPNFGNVSIFAVDFNNYNSQPKLYQFLEAFQYSTYEIYYDAMADVIYTAYLPSNKNIAVIQVFDLSNNTFLENKYQFNLNIDLDEPELCFFAYESMLYLGIVNQGENNPTGTSPIYLTQLNLQTNTIRDVINIPNAEIASACYTFVFDSNGYAIILQQDAAQDWGYTLYLKVIDLVSFEILTNVTYPNPMTYATYIFQSQ